MRTIYEQHKNHLFTLARGLVNDCDLAEDIVHDVFVSFARSLGKLRLHGSLRAYLSISVCNAARDRFRRKARQQKRGDDPVQREPRSDSPEVRLSMEESAQKLRAALQQIPQEQREVVLLRTKADLPFEAIAAQQGINANAARARYRYGLQKLRSLLEKEVSL